MKRAPERGNAYFSNPTNTSILKLTGSAVFWGEKGSSKLGKEARREKGYIYLLIIKENIYKYAELCMTICTFSIIVFKKKTSVWLLHM